jgi:hypothetical protein
MFLIFDRCIFEDLVGASVMCSDTVCSYLPKRAKSSVVVDGSTEEKQPMNESEQRRIAKLHLLTQENNIEEGGKSGVCCFCAPLLRNFALKTPSSLSSSPSTFANVFNVDAFISDSTIVADGGDVSAYAKIADVISSAVVSPSDHHTNKAQSRSTSKAINAALSHLCNLNIQREKETFPSPSSSSSSSPPWHESLCVCDRHMKFLSSSAVVPSPTSAATLRGVSKILMMFTASYHSPSIWDIWKKHNICVDELLILFQKAINGDAIPG